ncbi:MAG: MBOAT family protein [Polyangiales bacterium]
MLFNSLGYVLFLAVTFVAFWSLARHRVARISLLLAASYLFYMSWSAKFIGLVIASTVVDYGIGIALGRIEAQRPRKLLLLLSLTLNLGLLGLFKYADFFIEATADALTLAGVPTEPHLLRLTLPVGISFYTFQTLSYTIDVYRRRIPPAHNFIEFATYVAFFPQLIAGPIVRAKEFLPLLGVPPRIRRRDVGEGVFLILCGITKKVLVADYLGTNLIDRVFAGPDLYSSGEVWVAIYAYTWQMYGDFSGYTDIARGSARLFALELPENFDRPFMATGPIEFWKRWHITLSTWIQDYIYVPLGGSRKGEARTYANLFLTFFLIGVWHGAGWTFVLFGLWHASGVTLNRLYRRLTGGPKDLSGWKRAAVILVSFHFFVLQWPIFRSPTVERMSEVYARMFAGDWGSLRVPPSVWVLTIGMALVHASPKRWVTRLRDVVADLPAPALAVTSAAVAAAALYVGSQQAAPFIYFQF